MPGKAVPILEDYIREQWWMVAAKIHPDALTDITREKLAQGLLHPLEMTFASPACLYPLRLTGIAAGPVEELIYIEGTTHYEPLTFADDKWRIDVFGGPVREAAAGYDPPTIEHPIRIAEDETETTSKRYLTKLRRVFQPEEMTEDVVFTAMDYATLLAGRSWLAIAQGGTQYGRHRDPNGIPHLLVTLSPQVLEEVRPAPEDYQPWPAPSAEILSWTGVGKWLGSWMPVFKQDGSITTEFGCGHVRSCIWALGEIGIDHGATEDVEELLVLCAGHENQIVRMEAYVALTKAGSQRVGPILLDRLALILGNSAHLVMLQWPEACVGQAEADIIADWIMQHGAPHERDALLDSLADAMASLPVDPIQAVGLDEWSNITLTGWAAWLFDRAIASDDARFIAVFQNLHQKLADTDPLVLLLLKAEAACGSGEAVQSAARWLAESESRVLPTLAGPVENGYARLTPVGESGYSLRDRILRAGTRASGSWRAVAEINNAILHTALSQYDLDDWYKLYLLVQIDTPQASDREVIRAIWNTGEEGKRLVAVDVLWLWRDSETMLELYEQCDQRKVRFEIERLLRDLEGKPHR